MPGMVTQSHRGYKCFYTQLHFQDVAYVGPDVPFDFAEGRALVRDEQRSPSFVFPQTKLPGSARLGGWDTRPYVLYGGDKLL